MINDGQNTDLVFWKIPRQQCMLTLSAVAMIMRKEEKEMWGHCRDPVASAVLKPQGYKWS